MATNGELGCLCGKAGTSHLCDGSAHSSGCVVNAMVTFAHMYHLEPPIQLLHQNTDKVHSRREDITQNIVTMCGVYTYCFWRVSGERANLVIQLLAEWWRAGAIQVMRGKNDGVETKPKG